MNIPLYSLWTDTMFYVYAAAFFAALVALIYSIRGYLELANAAPYAEELAGPQLFPAAPEAEEQELPLPGPEAAEQPQQPEPQPQPAADSEKTVVVSNIEELISQSMKDAPALDETPAPRPAAETPAPAPQAEQQASRAEEFVKGIYQHISRIDSRLDAIEGTMAKTSGDFALKFLEDMMSDYDTLNKEKIKARIEFLISDLKK